MDYLDHFKLMIVEFAELDEAFLIAHLDNADSLIDTRFDEAIRKNLVVFLAAHNIDLATKRKGSGGQVTSISENKLKIEYAVNYEVKDNYDLSSYGREYKDLRRSAVITPLTRSV